MSETPPVGTTKVTDTMATPTLSYGVSVFLNDDQAWSQAARFYVERDAWWFRDLLAQSFGDADVVVFRWAPNVERLSRAIEPPAPR